MGRCLAPNPDDRYASAAQLAADLQAVADDGPLRFAREPIASRCVRWLRRNRRRLVRRRAACRWHWGSSAYSLVVARLAALRREAEVKQWVEISQAFGRGRQARTRHEPDRHGRPLWPQAMPDFAACTPKSERKTGTPERPKRSGTRPTSCSRSGNAFASPCSDSAATRAPRAGRSNRHWRNSRCPSDPDWIRRPPIEMLDSPRRTRLIDEVNELLFLWVVALDGEPARRPPGGPDLRRGAGLRHAGRTVAGDQGRDVPRNSPANRSPAQAIDPQRWRDVRPRLLSVGAPVRLGGADRRGDHMAGAGDPARAARLLVALLPGRLLRTHRAKRAGHGALSSGRRATARLSVGSMQPCASLPRARGLEPRTRRLESGPGVAPGCRLARRPGSFSAS